MMIKNDNNKKDPLIATTMSSGSFKKSAFNDEIITHYSVEGKIEKESKNGKIWNGLWTFWYENGQKKQEGLYKDGELVEVIGLWNEDGSVKE